MTGASPVPPHESTPLLWLICMRPATQLQFVAVQLLPPRPSPGTALGTTAVSTHASIWGALADTHRSAALPSLASQEKVVTSGASGVPPQKSVPLLFVDDR